MRFFPLRLAVPLACLLTLTACEGIGDAASSSDPTEPFTLAVGETIAFEAPDFSLALEAVPHDNRCPIDAVCITGGFASVAVKTWGNTARWVRLDTLAVGDALSDYTTSVEVGGYTITLLDVLPHPAFDNPSPTDQRAVLVARPDAE